MCKYAGCDCNICKNSDKFDICKYHSVRKGRHDCFSIGCEHFTLQEPFIFVKRWKTLRKKARWLISRAQIHLYSIKGYFTDRIFAR